MEVTSKKLGLRAEVLSIRNEIRIEKENLHTPSMKFDVSSFSFVELY